MNKVISGNGTDVMMAVKHWCPGNVKWRATLDGTAREDLFVEDIFNWILNDKKEPTMQFFCFHLKGGEEHI